MNKFDFDQLVGKTIKSAELSVSREGNMESDFLTLKFTDDSEFTLEVDLVQPKFSYTHVNTPDEDVPPGTQIYRSKGIMSEAQARFDEWALLELFGHQRLAGKVTEQQIGGASFVRVDVPDGKKKTFKLTRHYNPSAIYSITPVTEATARMLADKIVAEPITRWDVAEMVRDAQRALRPAPVDQED